MSDQQIRNLIYEVFRLCGVNSGVIRPSLIDELIRKYKLSVISTAPESPVGSDE